MILKSNDAIQQKKFLKATSQKKKKSGKVTINNMRKIHYQLKDFGFHYH